MLMLAPPAATQMATDYTSRVPFYSFPTTLDEQEAALASNPLLQRMLAHRRRYDSDPHRPLYHYVNPESRLNDPNGLCFWQGRWHLFYQAYPPEDPRQHWGHAVSNDLIHWRDLPYAIYPHPEDKCYSGATLVEDGRVIAMYHGTSAGNMIAVSEDPLLLNWRKLTDAPVFPLTGPESSPLPARAFDPCIWKKGDAYYSLSAGTQPTGPLGKLRRANYLLRSTDLENWEYLHPFVEDDAYTLIGDDGACPYFWPIGSGAGQRHILLFFSHMSGGQYLIGRYDEQRDKFVVSDGGLFNFGPSTPSGVHAPSATPNADGSVTVIFNMNPGLPTEDWDQIMTLPRRLTLAQDGELRVEPDGDVESLRSGHVHIGRTTIAANQDLPLDGITGSAMELQMTIDPKDAAMVELDVLRSPGREEYTRVCFYKERGFGNRFPGVLPPAMESRERSAHPARKDSLITLDNSYSSTLPGAMSRAPETAPVFVAPGEPLVLRVFVDRSVVEVFVNGRQCVAERVYPGRADSLGVSLRAQGSDALLESLDAWQMKSIY
jgi:beta-fructofuranosidase